MSTTGVPVNNPFSTAPPVTSFDYSGSGHGVQFYTEDAYLVNVLSRFIGTALGSGDAAIVIATKPHRDGLAQRLKANGLDTTAAIKKGRYLLLDAAETLEKFMLQGVPDWARFEAAISPYIKRAAELTEGETRRVAAYGEMVALLWEQGKLEAAIRLEELWNLLAEKHAFTLLCAYPMRGFCNDEHSHRFSQICANHSTVIPDEGYSSLNTEVERLRNIAQLQQKEHTLEAVRNAKDQLEKEMAERMDVERKLRRSEQSLRELSGRLLRMQDEERRRLGRELHDSVGQYLAALKMGLDSLHADITSKAAPDTSDKRVTECLELAEQSIREVRTISYLLYPPMLEEMGLKTAIPWYLDGFAKRSGIQTTFEILPDFGRLSRDLELAVFRVLQEGLTNVHRHSASTTAHVRVMMQDGTLTVEVTDRGAGIPPTIMESTREAVGTLGVGVRGMNERMRQLGGKLELFSNDQGTTVRATVPCDEISAEAGASVSSGSSVS
jgi:signal transduction histidine kinase